MRMTKGRPGYNAAPSLVGPWYRVFVREKKTFKIGKFRKEALLFLMNMTQQLLHIGHPSSTKLKKKARRWNTVVATCTAPTIKRTNRALHAHLSNLVLIVAARLPIGIAATS